MLNGGLVKRMDRTEFIGKLQLCYFGVKLQDS